MISLGFIDIFGNSMFAIGFPPILQILLFYEVVPREVIHKIEWMQDYFE